VVAGPSSLHPGGLKGQEASLWLPGLRPFEPLIAAPRETQLRGSFVLADRPDALDYAGRNIKAEVVIGHSVAILRMDDGTTTDSAAALGFELGFFSRFFMETSQKDLINVDFRVGLPISIRHDDWQVRITLRHLSSHVGDEYLVRFPERLVLQGNKLIQRTRDGIEGLVGTDLRVGWTHLRRRRLQLPHQQGGLEGSPSDWVGVGGLRPGGGRRYLALVRGQLRVPDPHGAVGKDARDRDGAQGQRASPTPRGTSPLRLVAHGPAGGGGGDLLWPGHQPHPVIGGTVTRSREIWPNEGLHRTFEP
jgi:hypothetical protein